MTKANKRLPPIHFHPILWAFAIMAILTGTFMELTVIFLIVFTHELGHYTAASWYNWRIRRIILWVFGGVMDTDEHGGKPIKEELIIVLAGPVQHLWIYGFVFAANNWALLPPSVIDLALQYNTTILLFNLLPIWPLDGGKLLLIFLSLFLSYRRAYSSMILCSMGLTIIGILILFFYFPFTLSAVSLAAFLLWENRLEWKQRYYVFLRFLLGRYRNQAHLSKVYPLVVDKNMTVMQICSLFKRGRRHHIFLDLPITKRNWMDEQECLHTYFMLKQYRATAKEMIEYKD